MSRAIVGRIDEIHIVESMLDDETDGSPQSVVAGVGSIAVPRSEDLTRFEHFTAAKSGAWIGSGAVSGWINRMPAIAAGWTQIRDMPAPARKTFHQLWRKRKRSS